MDLLGRLDEFDTPPGAFLAFLMVPIEPRIGEWRFAGVAKSLAGAIHQLGRFGASLWGGTPDGPAIIRDVIGELPEDADDLREYENSILEDSSGFPYQIPNEVLGSHRTVLCLERCAPYDDLGVFIVEVPAPAESPPGLTFEAAAVAGWRRATLAWVRKAGAEQYGPPPPDVWTKLERDSRPEDWTRWGEHWEEFEEWDDLVTPP